MNFQNDTTHQAMLHDASKWLHPYDRTSETLFSVSVLCIILVKNIFFYFLPSYLPHVPLLEACCVSRKEKFYVWYLMVEICSVCTILNPNFHHTVEMRSVSWVMKFLC